MKTEIPPALVNMTRGIMIAQARLVELDLSDNAFGPVGMEGLVTFLKSPSCFSLQELKLNNLSAMFRNLLHNTSYNPRVVSWVDEEVGCFKVASTTEFAKTWGRMKLNR